MSALFLAIPLTIFVLFVAPVWLWLHYSNRQNGAASLSSGDMQRLQQLTRTPGVCASVSVRWKRS